MRKLIISLLLISIGLLSACAPSNEVKEAKRIVKSIPLPTPSYSIYTGQRLIFGKLQIQALDYSGATGERSYRFVIQANEPSWWLRSFGSFIFVYHDQQVYLLCIPNYYPDAKLYPKNANEQPDNIYYGMERDKTVFTLKELKQYQDKLVWK